MSSTQRRAAGGAGLIGFARWWWRWWTDTRGTVLGVVVPAVFTLVGWILDARLMPLALAGGLAAGLLWPMGMAARGLAITGGVVVLGIAFIAAAGPAGILVLFVMLVGWGFVALLAGGLYLLFKRAC